MLLYRISKTIEQKTLFVNINKLFSNYDIIDDRNCLKNHIFEFLIKDVKDYDHWYLLFHQKDIIMD